MKKLFTLLFVIVATSTLWAHDFEVDGIYYKRSTKDGIMSASVDTIGWNIPSELLLTVSQARYICSGLESGETTGKKYYVMGYVKKIHSKHAEGVAVYGNAQFYMEDVRGANSTQDFMAFQVYGPNGKKITNPDAVAVGDFVVVYGELTNYNGTYETVGQGRAHIWKSSNPLFNDIPNVLPEEPEELVIPEEAKAWNIPAEAIDVIKAREICASLAAGDSTAEKYYVMGYVKKLHSKHAEGVTNYGNAQFFMENVKGKNSSYDFIAFQVFGPNGQKITDPAAVAEGDFVVVYGKLTNYMGNTYETVGRGSAYIWKSSNPLCVVPEPTEVKLLNKDPNIKAVVNNIKTQQNDDTCHYVVVTYQSLDQNNYSHITTIDIPETVEHEGVTYQVIGVGYNAFYNNQTIDQITIPQNINSIGDAAFSSVVSTINFESLTPPDITPYTFARTSATIYVPCDCVGVYQSVFNEPVQEHSAVFNVQISSTENGSAQVLKNTLCGAQIYATPNSGYHFVRWSDGNTDNPRTLVLTQDTTLTAEFAITYFGQCGDNLYWAYDEENKAISITGSGMMYDYTATTQPWYLFKEDIMKLNTSSTTTTLGESAFEGCKRLGEVTLGAGIEYIKANVFANCARLYHVYSYPSYTPFAEQSSFANYNVYLHVPCESFEMYNLDIVFGNFKYIQCISSDEVAADSVVINAGSTDVTITWPSDPDAETYSIVIKKNGEVVCTLTFNKDGQLLNIAFAPGRNGSHPAQYAEQVNNGYRFTVTGLEEGTDYTYTVTSKDAANKTISEHSGKFTTNSATALDNTHSQSTNCQKILRDGQLLIIRDGKTYNAQGVEL